MIGPSVIAFLSCASSVVFMSFVSRHQVLRALIGEGKRSGQSSLVRRGCAEWSEFVYPFRCNEVIAVVGGGFGRRVAMTYLGPVQLRPSPT